MGDGTADALRQVGGLRIAYQVTGEGPDLVMVPGLTSHLELQWRDPGCRRFVRSLSSFCRLLADAKITEHIRGIGDLPTFFRRSAGPGWALIGDAGHYKDPLIARGIADAFRDAAILADAIKRYWDSGLDEAATAYERRRDRDARPLAEASLAIAALDQPGSVLAERWRFAASLEQRLGS